MFAHQVGLFDVDETTVGTLKPQRTRLSRGAWVDHQPGWIAGSADLFAALLADVAWQAEQRPMYDKVVDVPRLTHFYGADEPLPHPLLVPIREALSAHYAPELGEPFTTAGMCLYRDGTDSVAWHGDTIGRSKTQDTLVAIVSLGDSRPLLLRPRSGGTSIRFAVGHGDLLVMGGSCQRTWNTAFPRRPSPSGLASACSSARATCASRGAAPPRPRAAATAEPSCPSRCRRR